jgi:hypothetical protein
VYFDWRTFFAIPRLGLLSADEYDPTAHAEILEWAERKLGDLFERLGWER